MGPLRWVVVDTGLYEILDCIRYWIVLDTLLYSLSMPRLYSRSISARLVTRLVRLIRLITRLSMQRKADAGQVGHQHDPAHHLHRQQLPRAHVVQDLGV